MKRVPEAHRLETAGGKAGDLEGDLDRLRPTRGKKHFPRPSRHHGAQRLGQGHSGIAGEPARGERQGAHLAIHSCEDLRVAVTDVMGRIAVKVQVPPAVGVLDPGTLGLHHRAQAGSRQRLSDKDLLIPAEESACRLAEGALGPADPVGARVHVPFALSSRSTRVQSLGSGQGFSPLAKRSSILSITGITSARLSTT